MSPLLDPPPTEKSARTKTSTTTTPSAFRGNLPVAATIAAVVQHQPLDGMCHAGPTVRIRFPPAESPQPFGSSAAEATPHSPLTAMQWRSEMNYAPEPRNFSVRGLGTGRWKNWITAAPRPRSH